MKKSSQIYYLDKNGNFTDRDNCEKVIIRELDDNGNLINEIFMHKNDNSSEETFEMTDEEIEFLKNNGLNYEDKKIK